MSTHSFNYRNIAVSYEKLGTGKPMIFLHGWGVSGEVMLPLAKQFSGTHTCYLIDLPGFGKTPPPATGWNVSDYADMVEAFIKEQLNELTNLLVHSFGGRIALKLCARPNAPQMIDNVLITGGAGMKPKRSTTYYLKKYAAKGLKAPFQVLPQKQKEKSLQKLRGTKLWKRLGSSDYTKLNGVMREVFVQTVTEYLEPCLPNIQNEVLLLWGRDDASTPVYQGKRMEEGIKNAALVVIENAGHYAFLDQPGRFNAIARAFFGGK